MNENYIIPKGVDPLINKFCLTIGLLPSSYLISLTYEEQILCIGKYLDEQVMPALNNNAEAVAQLQLLFTDLKNYVENYFDNLDVQEEINNKLDEMSEDGYFDNLLNNYLNIFKLYDTTEEMIADYSNLVDGQTIVTLGYYNVNDKGGSYFKITDTLDNTKYQISLGGGLYAEMLVGDSVNIKQFGANEDGSTADTTAFSNAITCLTKNNCKTLVLNNEKSYLITSKLTLDSISIIGNNSTIIYEHVPGSENYPFHFTGENFKIENLNFDLGDSTYLSPAIRLQNCTNVEIVNGYYTHYIDLYSNNKNIVQRNLRFTDKAGLTVRELLDNTTENILFENCICSRGEYPDEVIWIVSSYGTIKNVKCVNCTFIHQGGTENCIAISAYYNGSLTENVIFENCIFNCQVTGYHGIHIGGSTSGTPGNVKKVLFKDSRFNLSVFSDNYIVCRNHKNREDVIFDNCTINVSGSTRYGFWDCTFKDSYVNIDSQSYSFRRCDFNNCNLITDDSSYSTVGACNIVNTKMSCKGLVNVINVNQYGAENETKIINCDITTIGDTVFQTASNSGKIYLQDTKITNPVNSTVFSSVSVTGDCYYTIKNCDIATGYSKLSNYNTHAKLNIDNLTINNQPIAIDINDIDTNTRLAMQLNTLILAPIGTGLYYRKTSDGNAPGNFTLYGA